MLIRYCCGNLSILEKMDFDEICDIIDYLVEKENDETLLKAYQASYAAFQNINFADFKKRALEKASQGRYAAEQPKAEKVYEKVERYLNDFKWKEV